MHANNYQICLIHRDGGTKTVLGESVEYVKNSARRISCEKFKKAYILCILPKERDGIAIIKEVMKDLPEEIQSLVKKSDD